MANMSYCRFENTQRDLIDCKDALWETGIEDLSDSEKRYAEHLIKLCREIADDFEELLEEE